MTTGSPSTTSPADRPLKIEPGTRMGFFTDSSICIGCKACEVACKEWNQIPAPEEDIRWLARSYDNTGELSANHWRHVAFVEQRHDGGGPRWLMNSDVCKHCTTAACVEACPTGSLFRTEFDTVVVQEDICNGCGYCVAACPFGVLKRREDDGRVWKCTLCYDRLKGGQEPACSKACPTDSIQFGPWEELRERARTRVAALQAEGVEQARLYGEDTSDGVDGMGAFFLLLDKPSVYGLPDDPRTPTRDLKEIWTMAGVAAAALAAGLLAAAFGGRK